MGRLTSCFVVAIQPASKPVLKDITKALEKLNVCSFENKKRLLQAVVLCVLSDGLVDL